MNEVWAFSDIHGQGELFNKLMKNINPEDIIYFLGDAIDRGPDGWEILKELINRPNTFYLMGNHEDMMCDAIEDESYYSTSLWYSNGGAITHEALLKDNNYNTIIHKIKNLPLTFKYVNKNNTSIFMSHSGLTAIEFGGNKHITKEDYLWDRSHYYAKTYYGPEDTVIIHGHTPIRFIAEELGIEEPQGAIWYANNHKCCIDCGAHFTAHTVLMNLNTFEEEVIK